MPAEANTLTTGTLAADTVAVWLEDSLLELSERNLVFYPLCDKKKIPQKNGETIQFTRYERLSPPTRPLEEGVTPMATTIEISTVTAVLDQWGAVAVITDRAEMTVKHPTMQIVRDRMSEQHDDLVDREIQVVLMGSSAVYYAGNKTSRALLTAADVLRTDDIRRVVSQLRTLGARPYDAKGYRGVVDPSVEADISKDPTFVEASSFSQVQTLKDFEIGKWMGVWWSRSNYIPVISRMDAGFVSDSALTGGSIPAGGTGFTAGTTVRYKVTALDTDGFETSVLLEGDLTDGSDFALRVTLASGATSGLYRIYVTLEDGATGTETLQVTVTHTSGTAQTIDFVKAGSVAAPAYVVTGTGPVAPPDGPALNVHTSYVLGKNAVACVDLAGAGFETFYVPRKASESDPLAQRAKAGWKRMFKACVLNTDFFRRIESTSEFDV